MTGLAFHPDALAEFEAAVRHYEILVLAVMHCHRKPGYWRNRIETRS